MKLARKTAAKAVRLILMRVNQEMMGKGNAVTISLNYF